MAQDRNTYAKRQRETQKRQKAEEKRARRRKKKEFAADRGGVGPEQQQPAEVLVAPGMRAVRAQKSTVELPRHAPIGGKLSAPGNQTQVFQAGYDPRYTNPTGRTYYVRASYDF